MKMNEMALPVAILALVLGAFSLFLNVSSSTQQVYVDVNKLLEGYSRTATVRAEYETKAATLRANVDSLVGNWQQELKDYEKERASLSKKELELKQELLATRQQQINNYQQAVQKQLQEEDQKVTQTVINDINDFVKTYGKEKGYEIILGATGSGTLMYADEATDLTKDVLTQLNAQYEGR